MVFCLSMEEPFVFTEKKEDSVICTRDVNSNWRFESWSVEFMTFATYCSVAVGGEF